LRKERQFCAHLHIYLAPLNVLIGLNSRAVANRPYLNLLGGRVNRGKKKVRDRQEPRLSHI
jgi:hypothetical protein